MVTRWLISQTLHGTGIFTYIGVVWGVNRAAYDRHGMSGYSHFQERLQGFFAMAGLRRCFRPYNILYSVFLNWFGWCRNHVGHLFLRSSCFWYPNISITSPLDRFLLTFPLTVFLTCPLSCTLRLLFVCSNSYSEITKKLFWPPSAVGWTPSLKAKQSGLSHLLLGHWIPVKCWLRNFASKLTNPKPCEATAQAIPTIFEWLTTKATNLARKPVSLRSLSIKASYIGLRNYTPIYPHFLASFSPCFSPSPAGTAGAKPPHRLWPPSGALDLAWGRGC